MKLSKKFLIPFYIICFITLFFTFLYRIHVLPEGYGAPIILLSGFGLLIAGFFYFFFCLIKYNENKIILRLNIFSENTITTILIVLMISTFFIPAITFSEMAIDWSQIPILNYIRAIVFVIGCAFVPGSSIFCLLFPNSTIHEKLKIEPFFIKLVLYPLISLTFLGSISLILDQLGIMRDFFSLILFLTIIILHIFKIVKFRKDFRIKYVFHKSEVKISRNTLFILFLTISIILISLSIHLHTRYLFGIDGYIAMSSSRFIGLPDIKITDKFSSYTFYWGFITFSLSTLSGIPAINIMVLYFFLVYLFITSIYLFFKALLGDLNDKYAILAAVFATIFSSLYLIYENNKVFERISYFTYDGIFNLRYKGFAIILTIVSMTLFIIAFKKSNFKNLKRFCFTENWFILFVSAFFLIQSFIIYYLPIIPALSLIFFLILILAKRREQFKFYFYFSAFFIGFFCFFDLIFNNLFSKYTLASLYYFFGELMKFQVSDTILKFYITILSLICLLAIIPVVSICFKKLFSSCTKLNLRYKISPKSIFKIAILSYTVLLILEILLNLIRTIRTLYYFTFIIHLFYYNLGLTGILGVYLSFLCYKKNKQIFYIAFTWFICLFLIAIIPIIISWLFYPFLSPVELPVNSLFLRNSYWFNRTWYYSIIPISILASIGLIKLIKVLSLKFTIIRRKKRIDLSLKLISLSFFVFFLFSNSIIAGMFLNNEPYQTLDDEEIQVIGWITENLPINSNILVDRRRINTLLKSITTNNPYLINLEIEEAFNNYECWDIYQQHDYNCSIVLLEEFEGFTNVLEFNDNNNSGKISILTKSSSVQKSGSLEFNIRTTNNSKNFCVNISSFEGINVISLLIMDDGFYFLNGTNYHKLMDIENDAWYECKLDFECTQGFYSNLTKNTWKVRINGTLYGTYDFLNDVDNIRYINFSSSMIDYDYKTYINNLIFSWAPNFKIENCLYKYLIAFEHLGKKEVHYYIHSKIETDYNAIAKEFIDIDNDLIPKFYMNKLYEYQDLVIYSINF